MPPNFPSKCFATSSKGEDGEFRGIFTPFHTINFPGGRKSGGARATVASPSLAPLEIQIGCNFKTFFLVPFPTLDFIVMSNLYTKVKLFKNAYLKTI